MKENGLIFGKYREDSIGFYHEIDGKIFRPVETDIVETGKGDCQSIMVFDNSSLAKKREENRYRVEHNLNGDGALQSREGLPLLKQMTQ